MRSLPRGWLESVSKMRKSNKGDLYARHAFTLHLHTPHAEYVRTSWQTRMHSNRLRQRNGSDRCRCGRYKTRSIAHASKVLGESWIRSRVGNGIQIKRQKGGQRMQSLSSLLQSHRTQLHGLIPGMRMPKPKPHRLQNRARGEIADGGQGSVEEGAAEEGGAKSVTKPRQQVYPRMRRSDAD
jgi:hypothetical protein